MYRCVACDPGESTGWATGNIDKDARILEVTGDGWMPWKEFGLWLWESHAEEPFDFMIYESWRLRYGVARELNGSDLQPVQCVGQIKAAAWWASDKPVLVSQEPAIKPIIDKQMKVAGWPDYLPSSEVEHNRDALRHLWYFAVNKYNVKP